MTDDLRVLAEVFSENGCAMPSDVERLAKGYLSLLTSLEAREVELRMLKQSNTVLNERLEVVERDRDEAWSNLRVLVDVNRKKMEAAERERDAALDRLAERTADWNIALGRAEKAEAAVGVSELESALQAKLAHDVLEWYHGDNELMPQTLVDQLTVEAERLLEGREEKPNGN